ncbi:ATP-binding protein [Maribacter aestuarii]|uniref:receiver/sensor box histidine kinase n=1 Tax=Maribacter aestuarii TaxID=1130723 RepID=UPI0025A65F7B|nr:ATP-binding protein [Maribacter aestuarii]
METLEMSADVAQKTIDYECRLVPLRENRVLVISRNISESKVIQNTLNLRDKALAAAGNGIIIVDAQQPDMPIIYTNNAFTQITGYRQSEILGKNCRFLQNGDRDQKEIATVAKAIKEGMPCRVILRNYRKDGTLFWNELSITPLYDDEQQLTHFIGVQNDVTEIQQTKRQLEEYAEKLEEKVLERTKEIEATVQKLVETDLSLEDQIQITKLAEIKAQQSQAQFAAIAQNFPKGLIVVFNANYELVYLEGEELKRVNLKKSDFEGKRVDDIPIFSKSQIEMIKEDVRKTIAGKSLSFEMEFQDNFYSVNATPLKSNGESAVWALFVYHNITDQKNVQAELAKALKAEQELNALKSRFISMASHEFRTPLSAILSSAILIGKQNEPGKEERREKHVARIRTHVKHLVVILNDFLSLGKLEEGKVQAKPQYFELIQFCKIMVDEMEATKKEGQTIQLKHNEVKLYVFLDPKLLSHILVNLLSNALKYSDENQEIVMEIQEEDSGISFSITDYGIGIPEEEQERLFERFFRAKNATNIQGTGLGLHIVKQYTELMGGSIHFKSKPGKGSTFTVKLPHKPIEDEQNTTHRGQ